jgi:trans-2,3-dihydro-3-hydroxyanthranilate isomerase
MPNYRFLQLDVFTSTPFAGNPLAVFPEADGLSDGEMQKIAREMNLSETVFVLPPRDDRTLKRLRIFTPVRELPFAGHPIVGTWNALAREGVTPIPAGGTGVIRILHEVGIGILPVDIEFDSGEPVTVVMTQGRFESRGVIDDVGALERIARGLGLAVSDLHDDLPVEVISTGIPMLAVPVKSLSALGRCRVEAQVLSEAYQSVGAIGCYPFTTETMTGGGAAAHARLFAPDDNISEDPATGSAAGSLSGYLVNHGALKIEARNGTYEFLIEQGDFMGRPSRISAEVKGSQGNVEEVRIGGPSVVVARGELSF